MRDFKSSVAWAVSRYQSDYPRGVRRARHYSTEYSLGDGDIEENFLYTVLQSVNDGLVDDIKKSPDYICIANSV